MTWGSVTATQVAIGNKIALTRLGFPKLVYWWHKLYSVSKSIRSSPSHVQSINIVFWSIDHWHDQGAREVKYRFSPSPVPIHMSCLWTKQVYDDGNNRDMDNFFSRKIRGTKYILPLLQGEWHIKYHINNMWLSGFRKDGKELRDCLQQVQR